MRTLLIALMMTLATQAGADLLKWTSKQRNKSTHQKAFTRPAKTL